MMVKVHTTDTGLLAITPDRPRARTYYMGTVMLANVTLSDGVARGELIEEQTEAFPPTERVRKVMRKTHQPGSYKAAYLVGSDFYVR